MPATQHSLHLDLVDPDAYSWQPLRILAGYRLLIVALIAVVAVAVDTSVTKNADPKLFLSILGGYFGLGIGFYLLTRCRRPGFRLQVFAQFVVDIIAITALIVVSGTLSHGLGVMMVVAVAALSILVSLRTAITFASVASLLLLATQVGTQLRTGTPSVDYPQAGFLGMAIFATAALSSLLAQRARRSQALADSRGADLKSMEALNAHIVQAMSSGVLALLPDGRVRLMNTTAWSLLGRPAQPHGADIRSLAPALAEAVAAWRRRGTPEPAIVATEDRELNARFRPLGPGGQQGTLIFLDDTAELRAQVQQSQLAALGTLTANIAHEIRNPLNAIGHAAQLLEESPAIEGGDRRLLEIIRKQGKRLNRVVENVLQMSRRHTPNRTLIMLQPWLDDFVRDFGEQYPHKAYQLETHVEPDTLEIRFDPDHLHQVLTNLCRNALQHGGSESGVRIRIEARRRDDGRPLLEISDNGAGIAPDTAVRLFQPFFTTSRSGTGLGLYLCREICEANHARLNLAATPACAGSLGGACFQISPSEA